MEICIEQLELGDELKVAKLNLSLYGTRDAAQNWIEVYIRRLLELDFTAGRATPCKSWHGEHELFVTVHCHDFTIVGPMESLEWQVLT